MKCRKCGKELRPNDSFCYNCGEKTGFFQRFFSKKAFIGDIILGLIIIIAGIVTWKIVIGDISIKKEASTENNVTQSSIDEKSDITTTDNKSNKSNQDSSQTKAKNKSKKSKETRLKFPANVTSSMKKDFAKISKSMKPFLSYSAPYYNDGSHKFKWDDSSATVCALYNLYFDQKTIKYGSPYEKIAKEAKKEIKNLFGKSKKYTFTYGEYYPDYVFIKTNNTIIFNASHIRNGKKYDLQIKKIIETKKDNFKMTVRAGLKAANPSESSYEDYLLFLKKDNKSKYKYVVTKLALK